MAEYQVIKEKKGVPTVIELNGHRYILQQDRSKLDKAISKKLKEKKK